MPETKNYCQRVREVIRLRPLTRSTSRNGSTQNDTFGYNARSELVSATLGNANYAYAFDNIGNRETVSVAGTQSSYSTNNLNQYISIETESSSSLQEEGDRATSAVEALTYDADGNATQIRTSTGTWQITYNGANRPIRFRNDSTDTTVECGYDSQGRRYFKKVTVAGTVTLHHRYLYRGYLQIACVDCTRSGHPALWLVTWDPSQPTATRPLAIQKDGNWFTYGYDITKNVCEVFGPAGYIRTAYSYAPFGAVTESGDVTQPFQWSSEVYDSELDLVYYNYRHYSPTLGRFLSRDPIAEQGGLNLYAFVKNSPALRVDYNGLFAWSWEDVEDRVATTFVLDGSLGIGILGKTVVSVSVEGVKCTCSCSSVSCEQEWRYDSAKVVLNINVLLYKDSFYLRNKIELGWAARAEQDHVNDFQRWSETVGDDIVEDFKNNFVYNSENECVSDSADLLWTALDVSLGKANDESRKKWDSSGKHTYGHWNQRP